MLIRPIVVYVVLLAVKIGPKWLFGHERLPTSGLELQARWRSSHSVHFPVGKPRIDFLVKSRYSLVLLKLQAVTESACLAICHVYLKVSTIYLYQILMYKENKQWDIPLGLVTQGMLKTTPTG